MPNTKPIHGSVPPGAVAEPLSLQELAGVLVKHYGLHEGRYGVLLEFQIGFGAVGPDMQSQTPGAMVGVRRIGLVHSVAEDSPMTVDAAVVNPKKKKTATK